MTDFDDIPALMHNMGARARAATSQLAKAGTTQKNAALNAAAAALRASVPELLEANAKDVTFGEEKGLSAAMIDRLVLDESRIEAIAQGLEAIVALPDPVGDVLANWQRPNGLDISRVRVPLGVIGVIYESRPNVTVDAGSLCLKAGNAVILRGGSDALNTSKALHACMQAGLDHVGLPVDAVQLIDSPDRALVGAMLGHATGFDVIVPRGGKSLVERVQNESRVPVFAHLEGICHIYVDGGADVQMAAKIIANAKMRRPGVCGAVETVLIDKALAAKAADILGSVEAAGCTLKVDPIIAATLPDAERASDEDWSTEYLAPILSVAAVDGLDGALDHIERYGSGHTESIITESADTANAFLKRCDSAIVMHNASTQFADGGEFGMGAEIGIATGRMHARGPVGLEQLTSFQYQVRGTGQTRP